MTTCLPTTAQPFCAKVPPVYGSWSALWKYKAIYLQGDDRVGQWSAAVSIPVAG